MKFKIPNEIKNTLIFLVLASIMLVLFMLVVLGLSGYIQNI